MNKKQKITFIVNPISGTSSKEHIPELIEEMLDHERFDYEVRQTAYRGNAAEIARESAEAGVDVVVAVGGDGTVNEVARSLVHTQTALGIIPTGSGNGLARHLCIPMNSSKALEIINQCQIEAFDYGVINGLPFFCTCGMGFDAFISLKFAEAGKRVRDRGRDGHEALQGVPHCLCQCVAIRQQRLYCTGCDDEGR